MPTIGFKTLTGSFSTYCSEIQTCFFEKKMFYKKNIPRKDVFWMSFECVLEHIYCKFTVCILFDIFFQKDSDIVSDIFKKEICHFPFTKHKPTISHFSRCGLPGVVPPVWPPRRMGWPALGRPGGTRSSSAMTIPYEHGEHKPGTQRGSYNRGHNGRHNDCFFAADICRGLLLRS